jgi:hypothetical protein
MRYRLRTLLILLAVGPVFLAVSYWGVKEWQRRQAEVEARAEARAKALADAQRQIMLMDRYFKQLAQQAREEAKGTTSTASPPP